MSRKVRHSYSFVKTIADDKGALSDGVEGSVAERFKAKLRMSEK